MDLEKIQDYREEKKRLTERQEELDGVRSVGDKLAKAIEYQTAKHSAELKTVTQKVEVTNQPKIDVEHVTDFSPVVKALESLQTAVNKLPKNIVIPENEKVEEVSVKNLKDYTGKIDELIKTVKKIELSPEISVETPEVNVTTDNSDIAKKLDSVVKAVNSIKFPEPEKFDTKDLKKAIDAVTKSVNSLEFPIPNYVLPFKDTDGKATQVQLDASGNLPISASLSGADGAIVDGVDSGIEATVLDYTNSNPLAVRLTDTSGDYVTAGGGTQYAEGDTDASITGTAVMWEDSADTLRAVSSAKPLPVDLGANNDVTVTGTVTVDGSGVTQPVSASSLPLPSGASTAANQSTIIGHVDGIEGLLTTIDADTGNLPTIETNTDFGTVTGGGTETGALRVTLANNSTGVVSVDDNGGSLTVDGTVTANLSATDNAVLDSIDSAVNGTLTVDGSASTQPVSGTVTANLGATDNAVLDQIEVNTSLGSTSAVTSVAGSATSVQLLASNTDRKEAIITNDSTADLYVKLGTTASTTSYTVKLRQDETFTVDSYYGRIDGIWSSATGNARITEVSA